MVDADLVLDPRRRITFPDAHADVWPLFYDPILFRRVIDELAEPLRADVTKIAGIESRGFLLGAAVAARLAPGLSRSAKQPGLFPGAKPTETTGGDYRGNGHVLRLQLASCGSGDAVAVVDDWFETGSQASAAKALIERPRARYVGASIVVDQLSQQVRDLLAPCHSIIAADLLA